jgi:hypothetical protein
MQQPEPGPIALSPELRKLLVQVRRARGITSPPEVRASVLREVERALGGHLPRELLGFQLGTELDAEELAAFQPTIVLDPAPESRRVKHPTFGEGRVLRQLPPTSSRSTCRSRLVR